jgi:hypothetical protein
LLEATEAAQWIRRSRWGYAATNGLHLLGIALLIGSIVPLNLRLLGVWQSQSLSTLTRVLVPVATAGLSLAAVCGALLFLAAPADYLAAPVFLAKMLLVATGALSALWITLSGGIQAASINRQRFAAVVSLTCWISALALGRLIAFTTQ